MVSSSHPCSIYVDKLDANFSGGCSVFCVEIGVKNHIVDIISFVGVGLVLWGGVLFIISMVVRVAIKIRIIGISFSFWDIMGCVMGKKINQFISLPARIAAVVIRSIEWEKFLLFLFVLWRGDVDVGTNIR
jgi:hypothetical protein